MGRWADFLALLESSSNNKNRREKQQDDRKLFAKIFRSEIIFSLHGAKRERDEYIVDNI